MSEEIKDVEGKSDAEAKPAQAPTHADMFFRYISALAQAAGVQAFTMAIAAPKEDGTSAVMAFAAGAKDAGTEWQEETARLLGLQATEAAQKIVVPKPVEPVEVV